MDPQKGFHKYLITCDYSSLYPTIIRQFNISPEIFVKVDKNLDVKKHPNYIKCANGAIFEKNTDGILRTILSGLFIKRKEAQRTAKTIEHVIKNCKLNSIICSTATDIAVLGGKYPQKSLSMYGSEIRLNGFSDEMRVRSLLGFCERIARENNKFYF
jgi:hypothetical protein